MNASSSCLLTTPFDEDQLIDAVSECRKKLDGVPDLVFAFVSSDYKDHLKDLVEILQIYGHTSRVVGASAAGLFGVSEENEGASGVSLLFLQLPDTTLQLHEGENPTLLTPKPSSQDDSSWILLGNPLETTLSVPLRELNTARPGETVIGGLIRGGPTEDDLFLFTEAGIRDTPYFSLQLSGGIQLHPVVSQGCRPIGDPFVVTETSQNQILTIGRKEALAVLEETFAALDEEERAQAQGNIFAGLAATETVDDFDAGHFVIRHIIDANLEEGRLILDSPVRAGQTLQFQIREAESASNALKEDCTKAHESGHRPFGALLFGGYERGRRLFEEENHDIGVFEDVFGKIPLTGFYAHGEIGPVAGRAFRHDHSICGGLLINPESPDDSPESPDENEGDHS